MNFVAKMVNVFHMSIDVLWLKIEKDVQMNLILEIAVIGNVNLGNSSAMMNIVLIKT